MIGKLREGDVMAETLDLDKRWPELFAKLDQAQHWAVMQALASSWHEGVQHTREDVENLTDYVRGAIDKDEYRRRAHAAARRGPV